MAPDSDSRGPGLEIWYAACALLILLLFAVFVTQAMVKP
jgi:hypothetical protein